ncbi:type I restriction enzyme HsdR N-terminal domain-containing protein [Dehalococcoides mccartyi]|jgi:Uncharacterized conserved protein|uniref:type I restriction enzyme HsdR N-terminal domain-containing protein n=1 Tax=Dehalococcoides mccartyi TaxID=61435 RepID=UPI00098EADFA|nr:type I restriction enzyme HsdR N-terminal domain-containing protein [Dehalococcoides mccartyi]AQU06079.1 hypothetical protein B1777_05190 [Dehalococcoides mccartyi]AQU07523.1 hypothetical protein B1778_04995 [Dehalococcoides mccartyi]AQX74769.1 hypothetical protein B1776_04290 [Dehalococcoides mccartyi]AQY73346.1 hypothetical protein B1772_04600 [Dehalococcoides mccartyi]QBX64047.1 hypothetical protein DhcFL2_04630 [Dehalococcoides mccartyi]
MVEDKQARKVILDARKMIEEVAKTDGNEAETRRRIERIFDSVLGYDVFKHISREHAVHGIGDTEYCDFAIQIENDVASRPVILVEIKRVNVDLLPKHLKQTSSYSINVGCEWAVLTNGREWRLYHISFGQPPEVTLLASWDLLKDSPSDLIDKFEIISYKNVKKDTLSHLWQKSNVLSPQNMLRAILSEDALSLYRRELKRVTKVTVTPEDIVGAIRRLLNETAMGEMEKVRICLPKKKVVTKKVSSPGACGDTDKE